MEIGSVLELDEQVKYDSGLSDFEFILPFMENKKYRTLFYQSGRNAIEDLFSYLKETKNVKSALLPDYMCSTVADAVKRAGVEIINYRIDRNFFTNTDDIDRNTENVQVIYIAHFFGLPPVKELTDKIEDWKKQGKIIVEDITLSLFSEGEGQIGFGDYIIGSLRKWLPIPDGGFVSALNGDMPEAVPEGKVSRYSELYFDVQTMKREYINGGCKDKDLKDVYMKEYAESIDELFSDYEIYPMTKWSKTYTGNADFAWIKNKRTANFDYLVKLLKEIPGVVIANERSEGFLPFGILLNCDKRNDFLQYLIKNDIYCNVHWRLEESAQNEDVGYLAGRVITIPCDQRYNKEDMERIAQVIRKWYEEER